MSGVSRRSFLLSLLGLSALAGTAFYVHDRRRAVPDPASFIVDLIRGRFSYLEIDPEDLARFARDHVAQCQPEELTELRRAATGKGPSGYERRNFERQIAARFLLATDFYQQHGAPGSVAYVAYPDPYSLGCANPFVRREGESLA